MRLRFLISPWVGRESSRAHRVYRLQRKQLGIDLSRRRKNVTAPQQLARLVMLVRSPERSGNEGEGVNFYGHVRCVSLFGLCEETRYSGWFKRAG